MLRRVYKGTPWYGEIVKAPISMVKWMTDAYWIEYPDGKFLIANPEHPFKTTIRYTHKGWDTVRTVWIPEVVISTKTNEIIELYAQITKGDYERDFGIDTDDPNFNTEWEMISEHIAYRLNQLIGWTTYKIAVDDYGFLMYRTDTKQGGKR